ncbi:cache domain-containing protein [Candidatus Nitrososphaera sp. FF02]|uniref:cache domain-containing protein n=1 Tax=Candidatus Nitrososphaera sp. FF02 TaxID=3398226 RepID=UPI0039ED4434
MSIVSYQYSTAAANQILSIAADDIRSNAKIQAHDLSNILVNKVSAITNNLRVVAESPLFYDPGQTELAKQALDGMQDTTKDLTEVYFWMDEEGRLMWNSNVAGQEQSPGADRSFREYFTGPRDTGQLYYSSAIVSTDGIPRIHISAPIYDESGEFRGVIGTGIRLQVLGEYLKSQISPDFAGQVGMMDRNGIVLYSSNLELIGTDIFGEEVQSQLPEELKAPFNDFLRRSLSGGSGAEDLSYQGRSGSLAYQTVTVEGKDFLVIYVTAQHQFAENVLALVAQQQAFTWVMLAVIGAVAVGTAVILLSWNKRLGSVVKAKTGDLQAALQTVEDSNKKLEAANERIKAHDQMQTEFINIAAHELRTPIQPLLGAAEILEEEMEKGGDNVRITRAEVELITRNAKRLARLSSDLLEVSRIESNTLRLQKETFELNQKIRNVINDSRH